ncbi:MAG TPA: type IX secretion system sortase PorU, partial [Calditrichia bacterium]|nr:type IX secretion system sortase PorU [Calditrichia bacterium]
ERQLNNTDLMPQILVSGLSESNLRPMDADIYGSANPYPGLIAEIGEPYQQQRLRLVDIRIYPVQYHPAEHRVRLIEKLDIVVNLRGGKGGAAVRYSPETADFMAARVANFAQASGWALTSATGLNKTARVDYDLGLGQWFRIPVTEEGIFKITGAFLADQGIDIASISTSTIQVFGHGGAAIPVSLRADHPQDLNEIAIRVNDQNSNGVLDSNDEIYFYGRGPRGWDLGATANWTFFVNPFTFTNYYLLTFNQNTGKRIAEQPSLSDLQPLQPETFRDRVRLEEEQYNILESGLDWYWTRFRDISQTSAYTVNLPAGTQNSGGVIRTRFKGGSGAKYFEEPTTNHYRYNFALSVNGTQAINIGYLNGDNLFRNGRDRAPQASLDNLNPGGNQVSIQYNGSREGCYAFLDYLEFEFNRTFTADGNFLKIYYPLTEASTEFRVSGLAASNNWVWDISDPADISAISPSVNGAATTFQVRSADGTVGKTYYVFSPTVARTINSIEALSNSANLRDPNRRAKMLLIAADEFYEAAEVFEDFHETHPFEAMQVERIRVGDIFKEFSSGVPDPGAIRNFVKYAAENWGGGDPAGTPHYVFLIGDGSYDYRNILLTDYKNQIPVFEVTGEDDIISRATDNFFVAISDNVVSTSSLQPMLAIGRLQANSIADIDNYIAKLRNYTPSYLHSDADNGWQNTLTFVADDECVNSNCGEWMHLNMTEDLLDLVPDKFDSKKIFLTEYPTQAGGLGRLKPGATADLLDQLNQGTLLINYFGHGDPNTWAHEQVLTKARDLPLIANGNRLPLWVAATCTWGKYDNPELPSMSEEMVWSPSGGISVIAASRAVYAYQNEAFVGNLFRNLFHNASNNKSARRIGDAWLLAVGSGSNDQKYHIFGDPALHLADPKNRVEIGSISQDTLKALSQVTISAVMRDSAGNALSNFNGKALLKVYDARDDMLTNNNISYQKIGGTIFKGVVTVSNGVIDSASFIVPKSIKYKNARTGRVSVYAWSENQRDAVGFVDTLLFYGSASQTNDTRGPDIDIAFPNQPDFFDGDYLPSQPEISIRLQDDNGINLTREVGHRIELTIDNSIKKDVTEFFVYDENRFTEGQLNYVLPAFSPGQHTLTVTAWDNLNNYSESTVTFNTLSSSSIAVEEMVNFPNPFTEETQFTFQFQSPNGLGDVRVKIYTVTGRLIEELEGFVARPGFNKIPWDGTDRNGDKLANGVYLYKIIVDDGENRIEKIDKLAIVR